MFEAQVNREIAVSQETAWKLLADWGNTDWLPGIEKTEVTSEGARMTRRLFMGSAEPIEETLINIEPSAYTFEYQIPAGELFPLQSYQGRVKVFALGETCRVDWHCQFDLAGMSEDEANAIAMRNLNFLLDSLATYLEA